MTVMKTQNLSDTKADHNRILEMKEYIYESIRITGKTQSR